MIYGPLLSFDSMADYPTAEPHEFMLFMYNTTFFTYKWFFFTTIHIKVPKWLLSLSRKIINISLILLR